MSDAYTITSVPPTVAQTTTTVGTPSGELPRTGGDSGIEVVAALMLIAAGCIFLFLSLLKKSVHR